VDIIVDCMHYDNLLESCNREIIGIKKFSKAKALVSLVKKGYY